MIDALIQQFESPLCGFSTGAALDVVHPAGVVRDELMQTHVYSQSKHATPVQSVPPLRIGVVFSGGPAPGGHDVLCGILNHLRPRMLSLWAGRIARSEQGVNPRYSVD